MKEEKLMHDFKAGTSKGFTAMYNVFFFQLHCFATKIIKNREDAKRHSNIRIAYIIY